MYNRHNKFLIIGSLFLIAFIIILCVILIYINWNEKTDLDYGEFIDMGGRIYVNQARFVHPGVLNPPANIVPTPALVPEKDRANVDYYYEELQTHADDSQNVHDSQVIKCMNRKLEILNKYCQETYKINLGLAEVDFRAAVIADAFSQLDKYSETYFPKTINPTISKHKYQMAMETFRLSGNITSISLNNAGINEDYVLAMIWTRIIHPDNNMVCEKLQDNLMYQITECVERDKIAGLIRIAPRMVNDFEHSHDVVCITGRVSRILSSLTLLDADPVLSEPEKDISEYENIAYSKAAAILKAALATAGMQDLYIKDRDAMTAEELAEIDKFETNTKENIKNQLTAEYKDILSENLLTNIINKAQLGV